VNNTLYVASTGSDTVSAISLGPVSPTTIPALETFIQNSPQVSAGLNKGQKNSLIVKLENAATSFASGNISSGCARLGAFMNEVAAVEQSGQLDPVTAATLLSGAQAVKTASGCS
jgi:hypothetical protein